MLPGIRPLPDEGILADIENAILLVWWSLNSEDQYYSGKLVTTAAYAGNALALGFTSNHVIIAASEANNEDIQWSYDGGVTLHGEIGPGEMITMDQLQITNIDLKSVSGGQTFRVFAW